MHFSIKAFLNNKNTIQMHLIKETSLPNTSLIFLHQTRIRSQLIYTATLIAIVTAFASLPFIFTTVSVKGTGSLQSNLEKIELLAPISGRITLINLRDNQKVRADETLLSIDAALPEKQNTVLEKRKSELTNLLNDAVYVLNFTDRYNSGQPVLQTGLYAASWQQFLEQIQNASNTKEQAFKIYQRYKILYDKKVVTQSEYEQYKFNYDQALSDFKLVTKKYKLQWQVESNQYRTELKDLQNQKNQLTEQEKLYTLKAQVSGAVQNLAGLQKGSYLYANQKIGEISPDSALLAFCYIKPSDIGLIKKGQQVRFQIDAFNYNQWGLLEGIVADISEDIVVINQNTYFKVKCKLARDYLRLKNGYKGQVKKGMTFSARFTITRRSLFQLLYDQVDDWLNPSV